MISLLCSVGLGVRKAGLGVLGVPAPPPLEENTILLNSSTVVPNNVAAFSAHSTLANCHRLCELVPALTAPAQLRWYMPARTSQMTFSSDSETPRILKAATIRLNSTMARCLSSCFCKGVMNTLFSATRLVRCNSFLRAPSAPASKR